jgi:hypothetical protein
LVILFTEFRVSLIVHSKLELKFLSYSIFVVLFVIASQQSMDCFASFHPCGHCSNFQYFWFHFFLLFFSELNPSDFWY